MTSQDGVVDQPRRVAALTRAVDRHRHEIDLRTPALRIVISKPIGSDDPAAAVVKSIERFDPAAKRRFAPPPPPPPSPGRQRRSGQRKRGAGCGGCGGSKGASEVTTVTVEGRRLDVNDLGRHMDNKRGAARKCAECEHLREWGLWNGWWWCGTPVLLRWLTWLRDFARRRPRTPFAGCGCLLNAKWRLVHDLRTHVTKALSGCLWIVSGETIERQPTLTACPYGLW